MTITLDTPECTLSDMVAEFLAPICGDLEDVEGSRLVGAVTIIIRTHMRLIEARDDLAAMRQLRQKCEAEYVQLRRKVDHGCANHACDQCD